MKGGLTLNLANIVKNNKNPNSFFNTLSHKISKASNKRGLLIIGIDNIKGKVILFKGYIRDQIQCLGTITTKYGCIDLELYLKSIDVLPTDETLLPDMFLNMPYTFYILNSEKQEQLKF